MKRRDETAPKRAESAAADASQMAAEFLRWCTECGQKCCRNFGAYVTDLELEALTTRFGNRDFIVTLESFGQPINYLRFKKNRCVFLKPDGRCFIQDQKPLICSAYPLKYFWDGGRVRWFVSLFCPAVKFYTEKFLIQSLDPIRKTVGSWPASWLEQFTAFALLDEVNKPDDQKKLQEFVTHFDPGLERNRIFSGEEGDYQHPDLGLEIPLNPEQWLGIEIEHRSFLQAKLFSDPGVVVCAIIALQMAVPVNADDYGKDYVRWGREILKGFEILASGVQPIQDTDGYAVEYRFLEDDRPVTNLRYFLTTGGQLVILTCEGTREAEWGATKRQFNETIQNFRFTC